MERGYILAKGRRDYLLVDFYGGHYSAPKLIADKSVKIKDVREFLGKDFPVASLPELDEAKKLVAEHRKMIEQFEKDGAYEAELAELKRNQHARRQKLERVRENLQYRQRSLKLEQQARQKSAREQLRAGYLAEKRSIRLQRYRNRPTGLADFLGRFSGVNLIRKKFHQYQDAQRHDDYRQKRQELKERQQQEGAGLALRLSFQTRELGRRAKALGKVEKRELQSLDKEYKREQRIQVRGRNNEIPSLEAVAGLERADAREKKKRPDLMQAFENAQKAKRRSPPDLMAAFERATNSKESGEKESGSSEGPRKGISPQSRTRRGRKRRRDNDREH